MTLARSEASDLLRKWLRRGLYVYLSAGIPSGVSVPDFSPTWDINSGNAAVNGVKLIYNGYSDSEQAGEGDRANSDGMGTYLVAASNSNKLLCYGRLKSPIRCVRNTYIFLQNGTVLINFDAGD